MKKINYQFRITHILLGLSIIMVTFACEGQKKDDSESASTTQPPKTSIQEAAYYGNKEVIKAYITTKSDLNQKDPYGSTPLHIAITFGRIDVANLLIEGGADINSTSADGSTPLHSAAFFGRTAIVKTLLNNGADTTIKNNHQITALTSVTIPFKEIKPVYDQISKDLGPLGLKLDYEQLQKNRPIIAQLITENSK